MEIVHLPTAYDGDCFELMRGVEQCSRRGEVHVWLFGDALMEEVLGQAPRFPLAERRYVVESVRGVESVRDLDSAEGLALPEGEVWVIEGDVAGRMFPDAEVIRREAVDDVPAVHWERGEGKRVVVTGCFDYLHSGHVRFFEEASDYGELHVVVGSDANVRLLKGPSLPMFPEWRRQYAVSRLRMVAGAHISSGSGWMDAEPEIAQIQPDFYVVNEDGDRPEKRDFCLSHGLEYVVLSRTPKPGLPVRSSTQLRGF